jgi:hypothetical protein
MAKNIGWFVFHLLMVNSLIGQSDSLELGLKVRKKNNDSISLHRLSKRPRNAFLAGVIMPGAGQIINKRWWKLPIAYAGYAWLGYNIVSKQDRYNEFSAFYDRAITTMKPIEVRPGLLFDAKQIKLYRDKFRDNRDVAIFTAVGVHLLIALEAYVDAHLKDFDIDDNLSLKISPSARALALVYQIR